MEGADLAHLGLLGLASLLKNGVLRRYAKHAGSPSDPNDTQTLMFSPTNPPTRPKARPSSEQHYRYHTDTNSQPQ